MPSWRRSSFSAGGENCVEIAWRKSSFTADENCVEIAKLPDAMLVRDSKDPEGGMLTFPVTALDKFRDSVVL